MSGVLGGSDDHELRSDDNSLQYSQGVPNNVAKSTGYYTGFVVFYKNINIKGGAYCYNSVSTWGRLLHCKYGGPMASPWTNLLWNTCSINYNVVGRLSKPEPQDQETTGPSPIDKTTANNKAREGHYKHDSKKVASKEKKTYMDVLIFMSDILRATADSAIVLIVYISY